MEDIMQKSLPPKPRAIAMKPLPPGKPSTPITPSIGSAQFFQNGLVPNMPLFTLNSSGHAMPVLPSNISPQMVAMSYQKTLAGVCSPFGLFAPANPAPGTRALTSASQVITPPVSPALLPRQMTPNSKKLKSQGKSDSKPSTKEKKQKLTRRRLKAKDPQLCETIAEMCAERIVGRFPMSLDDMQSSLLEIHKMLSGLADLQQTPNVVQLSQRLRRIRAKMKVRLNNKSKYDIDSWITNHLKVVHVHPLLLNDFDSSIFARRKKYQVTDGQAANDESPVENTDDSIPYDKSFKRKLQGDSENVHTIDCAPTRSPFSNRTLSPFLWRDYETQSAQMKIHEHIRSLSKNQTDYLPPQSIDYTYLRPHHLKQVNALLTRLLWPGIDLSADLRYPEHAIVVLYGRKVIACGVLDLGPSSSYITYLAVDYGWRACGIASTLMYFLTSMYKKDVLLHVQPTNWDAMRVYQRWGFKAEQYLVGFYDRYVPWKDGEGPGNWSTRGSRNAMYMRLRK